MPLLLLYGQQLILATHTDLAKEIACSIGGGKVVSKKTQQGMDFSKIPG